jgi:trimethylamine--corrinoid protein Co-methyltransferase
MSQWLNHLLSCLGKVGLAPFVGDNLDSKAFSPAIIVLADEIIAQARLLAGGFGLDDAAVAMEEMAHAGPGGSFLLPDMTLRHFRQAYQHSAFFPKRTLEGWQAGGCPRAADVLRQHTRQLLDQLEAPGDHDELMARGEASIRALADRQR